MNKNTKKLRSLAAKSYGAANKSARSQGVTSTVKRFNTRIGKDMEVSVTIRSSSTPRVKKKAKVGYSAQAFSR